MEFLLTIKLETLVITLAVIMLFLLTRRYVIKKKRKFKRYVRMIKSQLLRKIIFLIIGF